MRQISQLVFGKLTRLKPLDLSSAAANAAILPLNLPIEEEKKQNYDPKQFYPVKLGEIFHDRYQIVVKVGFGGHSTVWLARNLHRYVFDS
jgi:serine/threonine-protein kinase SRPK3